MMSRITLAACTASAALITGAAHAGEGWYIEAGGGLNNQGEELYEGQIFRDQADSEPGSLFYGAIGRATETGLRVEGEVQRRGGDLDNWEVLGAGDGDISMIGFFGNVIYEFNQDGKVSPYAGVGAGYARLKSDLRDAGGVVMIDDSDSGFAWQGIAGVAVELVENLDLTVGYRYTAMDSREFEATIPAETISADYSAHGVFAGLRFAFGMPKAAAPAPAPAPLVAPEPEPEEVEAPDDREFVVYFELNKSNLSPQAANTIRQAASYAQQYDIDIVVVEGHTDTSGTTAHNQVLSQERAENVTSALASNGVPREKIRTSALGESRPARSLGDGVREPLNRRVELEIRFER